MPSLCCGSKATEDAVVIDATSNKEDPVPPKGEQAQEHDDNEAAAAAAAKDKEERELAASVYHDARQSMTDSMMYRPARSVIGRFKGLNLDTKPEELLKSHHAAAAAGSVIPVRDSVAVVREGLEKRQEVITQAGYPGELTDAELEACLEFRRLIKEKRDQQGESMYYEMVHILDGLEEEAFAICRIMRSRKFVVEDVFKLLDESLEPWKEGRQHDFYPNLSCPPSLVHTHLPLIQSGIAQNGSLVFYFQVETVSLEALECFTELDNFIPYIWNLLTHAYPKNFIQLQEQHPNQTILAELTVILDLKGIQRSIFADQVMQLLKRVVSVLNCFPEILSKAIIINAPYFFSMIWMVFRQLMDARTTAKVDIYSSEQKGIACMQQYIDQEELLSNYGGQGPSYESVLQEMSKKEGTTRQMVERFFLEPPKGEAVYELDLTSNEKASIVVFTRSTAGAKFTVAKATTTIHEMQVKPSDGSNAHPYTREVASEVLGPGKFTVSCKSISHEKEYFLVQICVYSV